MQHTLFLNELLLRFDGLIKFVISQYFKNKMDKDDVFQDISLHIFDKLQKTSSEELSKWTSEAWIRVIVRNQCITILRKRQSESKREKVMTNDDQFEREIPIDFNSQINFDKSLKAIAIEQVLLELKEKDRKLIILRFFKQKSIAEIDQLCGVKNSAVYISRIIDKLKNILGADSFYDYFDDYIIED